ncbi:hypothetical protein AJ80_03672 [Polytolypa hystricis UAMH7299]|uniref:Phenol 2-monooxygenase n=1 Tax=Polytolypa hystricis (strain UAMH7299) TaxID=1447883 RepID=A0A2B7Y7P2_POLH7|nr:hypothetical protein AJ80_03672 [Polytolypa hystricis UAMH7299]
MAIPVADSTVDVLIVGAGPAGLMLANWMSRFNLKTRIVDKRGTKIFNGQADGLQCRTLEILDSFDIGHRIWRESNHMVEICLWNPDETGRIRRSDRIPDTIVGISRFQQVVLHQGRIERFFLDAIKENKADLKVERGVMPTTFDFDASKAADFKDYPITVTLRTLTEDEATPCQSGTASSPGGTEIQDGLFRSNLAPDDTADLIARAELNSRAGQTEVVKARFMVGCDGAHSWVRQQLGYSLTGDSTDYIWGVLDIVPVTDFPDIRMRCAIHSESQGSVMIIPRENKLVRLYIQLKEVPLGEGGRADRSKITPDVILKSAQKIFAPYTLTYTHCDWWTAYQIGQRVGDKFSLDERVFLAGDAVHTHSPKAGQGMNVSMQDTYNLGWKIALVASGVCDPAILKTYETERKKIAQDLISFDHRFSRLFSGRPAKDVMDEEGISMDEFKMAFEKGNMFASGVAVDYKDSLIVSRSTSPSTSTLIQNSDPGRTISIGMRMPSFKVLNQSDARPWHLQERLPSDGRWRILVFPGDITTPTALSRYTSLGTKLAAKNSFLHRFTPPGAKIDSVIEILTIHSAPRRDIELTDLPEIFHPYCETIGWDYWKVFADDESYHEGHGQCYENLGLERKGAGAVVVLRPDQYVSWVGEMGDYEGLEKFFGGFMVERK